MNKTILVVDDDPGVRNVIQNFLIKKEYMVTSAQDGLEAIEKMTDSTFDLYLIDMSMPKMDGYELMKNIKQKHPLAVIIILTGYSSIEGAVKAVHAGAYKYLSKPINLDELHQAVQKGLQYSENLYGPMQKVFEANETELKKGEPILLQGFSTDDKLDFYELGQIKKVMAGENLPIDTNCIVIVESGEISIWHNNTTIDYLQKGDSWGEENFILSTSIFTTLRIEKNAVLKIFERRKLVDYFGYKGEKLLKTFIINIENCLYVKWRKAIQRIVILKLVTDNN